MQTKKNLSELPNRPAVYALMGGSGGHAYVAYVGIAGKLKNRIAQHLVLRDSSVTTGTSATMLNPDYVTKVKWWEHPGFEEQPRREAAELVALDVFNPALRSRGKTSESAWKLFEDKALHKAMTALLEGEPTGTFAVPTLQSALDRISELEERVALPEEKLRGGSLSRRPTPE